MHCAPGRRRRRRPSRPPTTAANRPVVPGERRGRDAVEGDAGAAASPAATRLVAAVPPALRTPTDSSWPPSPASRASPSGGQVDDDVRPGSAGGTTGGAGGRGRPAGRPAAVGWWRPGRCSRPRVGGRSGVPARRTSARRGRLVRREVGRQVGGLHGRRDGVRLRGRSDRRRGRRSTATPTTTGPATRRATVVGTREQAHDADRRDGRERHAADDDRGRAPIGIAASRAATPPAAAAPLAAPPSRPRRAPVSTAAAPAAAPAPPAAAAARPLRPHRTRPPRRVPHRGARRPRRQHRRPRRWPPHRPRGRRRPGSATPSTPRAAMPEHERGDDGAHAVVDVAELEHQAATGPAVLQVRLDLGGLARAEPVADVGAELARDRAAARRRAGPAGAAGGTPAAVPRAPGRTGRRRRSRSARGSGRSRPGSAPRPRCATARPATVRAASGTRARRRPARSPASAGSSAVAGHRGAALEDGDVVGRLDAARLVPADRPRPGARR